MDPNFMRDMQEGLAKGAGVPLDTKPEKEEAPSPPAEEKVQNEETVEL
jgi:hypothetical protein